MPTFIILCMVCVVSLIILRVFYCYWKQTEEVLTRQRQEIRNLANSLRLKGIECANLKNQLKRARRL